MIPPTSIDGTDITGATIDGTDVQEITVDGDTVFSATKIIDDFEDGNISEYTNDLGNFAIESANPITGSHSLKCIGTGSVPSITSSTLSNIPQAGDTFEFKFEKRSGSSSTGFLFCVFGADSGYGPFHFGDGYHVDLAFNGSNLRLAHQTSGSVTQNTSSYSYSLNTVYTVEVVFGSSTLEANLFESGTLQTTVTIGSIPTFTGDFGWAAGDETFFVDDAKITG